MSASSTAPSMEPGRAIQGLASILKNVQNGLIRSYAAWILLGTVAILLYFFYVPELDATNMDVPYILSIVTYLPALVALLLLFIPRGFDRTVKICRISGLPDHVHSLAPSLSIILTRPAATCSLKHPCAWIQTATYSIQPSSRD